MTLRITAPLVANWLPSMSAVIEAYDTVTQKTETLLKANMPLQAPSWTPDGGAILVNANGQLFEVPLDINPRVLRYHFTEGLYSTQCDRGYSPDGSKLALTDYTKADRACIYLIERDTHRPQQLTADLPSWFHGWAPDSQSILYSGRRAGSWVIAACGIDGVDEQILLSTDPRSGTMLDGPEFTPDGAWIWFNANFEPDNMVLWRMRPDGSAKEQMSDGARCDWFPHPSPDGRHVCYLSYRKGTTGHAFGRDVEIRTMPAAGGTPRVIARVHGGQGSLNAPCWSPDGRRFAYVHFEKLNAGKKAGQAPPELVERTREIPEDFYGNQIGFGSGAIFWPRS
jgi:Tol biopolymer transport system component